MNYINIEQADYKFIGIVDGRVKLRRMSSGAKSPKYIGCGVEPSFRIKFDYREGHYIEVPSDSWGVKKIFRVRDLIKGWELMNEIIYDMEDRNGVD